MHIIHQKQTNLILIGVLLALLLAACSPAGGNEPAASDEQPAGDGATSGSAAEDEESGLIGPVWLLQLLNGVPPLADAVPTLEFSADGVSGNTGCNSYFGRLVINGTQLSINQVGMTEMYCDGRMEQETAYLALLQAVTGYTLSEGELTLHGAEGDLVFAVAADADLEGTNWVLGGIATNDAVVSTRIDDEINMVFADGTVSGSSGCNSFSGSYTVNGAELSLGPTAGTLMACADEERNQREMEFLAALAAVHSYAIKRDTLSLYNAAGEFLMSLTATAEATVADEIVIFVGPEKVTCIGVAPQECLQVKWSAAGEWELFYDQIAGFDWQPGFLYELRVRRMAVENPPADGSALQYELLEVVAQTPAE